MPRYTVRKNGRIVEVTMTYAQYDEAKAAGVEFVMDPDGVATTIFNGPGFTRRSTDSRQNLNIDHHDWRGTENWPGPPEKKTKRPKITNWTADQFRKGAV